MVEGKQSLLFFMKVNLHKLNVFENKGFVFNTQSKKIEEVRKVAMTILAVYPQK